MDTALVVAPLMVAGLGFIAFLAGVAHLVRGRPGQASFGLGAGALLAIAGLAGGLIGGNLQTYARLAYEVPLAEISVRAIDPVHKRYAVILTRLDGTARKQTCNLQGDAWEIGGRFQKWKPWANELGLNATYTLDQLSNRYNRAAEANGKPITACDIGWPPPKANAWLPEKWLDWLLGHMQVKERFFGSASYMPMVDGAKYTVIATQFGFNAEPSNAIALRANQAQAW